MLQQQTTTLKTIFSEVLADLAFMFTDDDPADMIDENLWFETQIGYRGEKDSGTLRLRCPHSFAVELAANLLGIESDDELAESGARDATKEFMNVVCGQFITSMYGTEQVFDLSIPEIEELTERPDISPGGENASTLMIDGKPVQLALVANE